GIGRGIALELAREGARVVVGDIQETPKRGIHHDTDVTTPTVEEVEKLGGEGLFVQADMGNEEAVHILVERGAEHFGGLDILVNNAGIHIPANSQELSIADWDKVLGVNLRGVFIASKLAIPYLKKSSAGRIVNIASVHAFRGGGGPVYAPAKAGVVNLTKDLAVELGADNVTVNAICPGYIETPIQDYLTEEDIQMARNKTPLPRLGRSWDIGRAVVFFASDDAEWITGTALPVDGGWLAPI
ncbi:MAG: SDR family NAD(P)-dependent oxidoreductase, partial [bacterium]|nr:SDR family NAD(P)-dependent oxidoreductase [bacterium]